MYSTWVSAATITKKLYVNTYFVQAQTDSELIGFVTAMILTADAIDHKIIE